MTEQKTVKVCVAGKNEIAVFGLELLLKKVNKNDLIIVSNNSDDGYDTWQPSLRKKAAETGVSEVDLDDCHNIPELIFISLEFDKLINPEAFLTKYLFNIHFSALPAYKGMYTSAIPLLHDEDYSGVTLHKIDKGIDTGEIVDQQIFSIDDSDTARDLYQKYTAHSKFLLSNWIDKLLIGNVNSTAQSAHGSTYYSRNSIRYNELSIDLMATAYQIKNQIRAFTFPEYQVPSIENYRVNHAEITTHASTSKAGEILYVNPMELSIATIDYDIVLKRDKTAELMYSASCDDLALAKECLENGANQNWRNNRGWSPLIVASYFGSISVIQLLVDNRADLNLCNFKGTTPLMYAMSYYEKTGNSMAFELLLDHGADIHLRDANNKSLVDYATERKVIGLKSLASQIE